MSGLKTILLTCLSLAAAAPQARADAALHELFAACVGRYSAQMEHAWLMQTADAAEYESRRLTFLSLLDATVPEGRARETLSYRIDVKMAHASLLAVAEFSDNADRARAARQMAARHIASCQALVLGG